MMRRFLPLDDWLTGVFAERAEHLDMGSTAALMQVILGRRPTEAVILIGLHRENLSSAQLRQLRKRLAA